MDSAAMDEQEGNEITRSDPSLHISDHITIRTIKDIQFKDKFAGTDFAPKVRKPYTISKQRERWSEEEHTKFLEALKLFGRAWRKIEEHVGTKTAVQIRSHAQKFFSKVVRESNTVDSGSAKPIEIPPPRPKRKPMHPYPRKVVSPVKNGILIPDKPSISASPNVYMSGQENQSPKSVLFAIGSDTSAEAGSCVPNGSQSPVSSALANNADTILGHENDNSSPDEKCSPKACLKLFGKTLVVEDSQMSSCSNQGACKIESLDRSEEIQSFPWRVVPLKFPTSTSEYVWSSFRDGSLPVCLPWLTLCGGASFSTPEVCNPTPIKPHPLCDKKEKLDREEQKEGSSTGSNSDIDSASANEEKNWDIDSCPVSLERQQKVEKPFSSYKSSKRISANSTACRKMGFLPYKRCSV